MSASTHSQSPATPDNSDDRLREEAREYVHRLRACQVHATVFAAGMVVILLENLFTNKAAGISGGEWSAWWSAWALIGWGLGVAFHGLVVQLSRPGISTAIREEKQIDKVLASMDSHS
jgi:hypothetical protein